MAILLNLFWLFALLNPFFKKYDYGAGWPLVICFAVFVGVLVWKNFREQREKNMGEEFSLLFFLLAVGVSFLLSQTKNVGFSEVLAFFAAVTFYLAVANAKIAWKKAFLQTVAVGGFLAVLVSIGIYIFAPETRMSGPFLNLFYHSNVWPNAFALFLLMLWPVYLILFKENWKWKHSVLLGLILACLFLTYSRGAIIALAGQIVLLQLYFFEPTTNLGKIRQDISSRGFKQVLLTGLCIFVFFLGINGLRSANHELLNLQERVTFQNQEGLTSTQERIDFWKGAITLAKEKPFFGWGPFSFREAYNPIQKTFLGNSDHPHNVFLKILAENGIFALAGLLIFAFLLFKKVIQRFPRLKQERKDLVYLSFVSVAGAVAHNLIDYNLNFLVNLWLLFALLALIRGEVVKVRKRSKPYHLVVLGLVIGVFAVYEGAILVMANLSDDHYYQYSLFPRNYYLDRPEKHLELNPLSAEAYHRLGLEFCDQGKMDLCRENLKKAVELNPKNEFRYYLEYLRVANDEEVKAQAVGLLEKYFYYVENNVHFTAYTQNVEDAADLIELLLPQLPPEKALEFQEKRSIMLQTADQIRSQKTF